VSISVAAVLLVAAVVVAVLLTRGSSEDKATASGPTQSPSPPLRVTTRVTRIAGSLPAPRRQSLRQHLDALVQDYLQAAFVDPRGSSADFPGFTPAARSLASHDARVLTAGATRTEVKRAAAYVSVFADHGRAHGATVRLVLALVSGDGARPQPMVGRLLLTPTSSGWRVFGYDMARGAGR
jgi:hypothetical protein